MNIFFHNGKLFSQNGFISVLWNRTVNFLHCAIKFLCENFIHPVWNTRERPGTHWALLKLFHTLFFCKLHFDVKTNRNQPFFHLFIENLFLNSFLLSKCEKKVKRTFFMTFHGTLQGDFQGSKGGLGKRPPSSSSSIIRNLWNLYSMQQWLFLITQIIVCQ